VPWLGKKFSVLLGQQSSLTAPPTGAVGQILIDATETHVAVVSHDCEFNEGKRSKFLVARVQRQRGDLSSEQLEAFRASNDVQQRVAAGEQVAGIDAFVYEPYDDVFTDEMVVSFPTIFPMPMDMKDDLVSVKKAELTTEARVLFRKKLGLFFARDADDIPDAEKFDRPLPDGHDSGSRL